jgi:hypothetical protein
MKEVRKDEPDASGILGSHTFKPELESASLLKSNASGIRTATQ